MLKKLFVTVVIVVITSSCAHYEVLPLDHNEVVQRMEQLRQQTEPINPQPFSFVEAMALMDQNNRRLMEIKQAYETMKDVESIPTPLPNPSLTTGIRHGKNLPNDFSSATQPFISLAFTVPLSSRLSKQDSVNSAMVKEQVTLLKIDHRRLYLELRELYGTLYFLQQKKRTLEQLTKFVQWKLDETTKLQKGGIYSPLDAAVIRQQLNVVRLSEFDITSEMLKSSQKLAILLDLPQAQLDQMVYEKPPLFIEGFNRLKDSKQAILLENHLAMARLRSSYQVIEQQLQLEITKQYPDLKIGADHKLEPGETKEFFGLFLGMTLPIFDRNQVGIARVSGKRKELLRSYQKEVSTALIKSDYLLSQFENSYNQYAHHDETVLKQAYQNRNLAQKSFKSNKISLLRYWEFEEEVIKLELKSTENYISFWQNQSKFEQLLGKAVTQFPNELKPTTLEKDND